MALADPHVTLKRATAAEARQIAELYLAARADALPYLRRIHTDESVGTWIQDILLTQTETWVAYRANLVAGFMSLNADHLDQLYVHPDYYRQGIGSMLLQKAKERSPNRLSLFTFQRNDRARTFYESHGFTVVDTDDGSRNEEQEPDVHYEWQNGQSV
jgi:ribosomal protein S18 acetylase RimI-like enzyme